MPPLAPLRTGSAAASALAQLVLVVACSATSTPPPPPDPVESVVAPTPPSTDTPPPAAPTAPPPAPEAPVPEPPATTPAPPMAPVPSSPAPGRQACGRLPSQPIAKKSWRYGGGTPNPECDGAETVWANVPHGDRACHVDTDCVVIDRGCFVTALNQLGASKPAYEATPCGHPAAGACAQREHHATCQAGCCVVH